MGIGRQILALDGFLRRALLVRSVHRDEVRDAMTVLPKAAALRGGDLRYVYLHWTGGDRETVYDAYHVCVARSAAGLDVVLSHDVRDNMRDVAGGSDLAYAAHTAGRNSFALGVAVCGMRDASPSHFGAYPLEDDALGLACEVIAGACAFYGIPVDERHVRTHAEAAVEDGYFGCGDDERWDVARFAPSAAPLVAAEAFAAGNALRERIRAR